MAANIALTKTFNRICTIAEGYTGITAARVLRGHERFTDLENFYKRVRALTAGSQAYFWASIKAVPSQGALQRQIWRFSAELYMALNKDATDDLTVYWEYAMALQAALETEATYGNGEHCPHVSIAIAPVDVMGGLGMVVFDFGSGRYGGSMEVIDP